jgi:tetratricopeptide (TPR) repeat protein
MAEIFLREYREQIERTIEQGRYVEAVAHGKHILKQYPKHVAPYRLMGKAMLEANQDRYAADMFRRVLGADPENMVAWVGLSEVHNARGELDAAIWHLERALEVDVGNEIVAEELRRLYGRRDGVEPQRVELTRGALARLYLKGGLLSRAISEFRDLLAENPERVDLSVALAETLWRNEQRLEAVAVCQQVLDALPYCLKANLILGEIWTRSGREEGQTYLRRAEALDPENQMAQELFEAASPLPAREVRIVPLEYRPPSEAARPAWMADIEAVSAERPSALFDVAGALEAQIEIPAWLEEVVGEEAVAPVPPSPAEPPEALPPEEAVPAPAEEVPEWLAGLREGFGEEAPEAVAEAEPSDWLAGLGLAPLGAEEVPEQLAEPGTEPTGVTEAPAAPGPEEKEALEWLAAPGVEAVTEEAAPPLPPTELPADWLAGIREQLTEDEGAPEEAPTPVAEEAPAPVWLEGEGVPSGDEALAWLEQLAAGKEEELRAQAQAEAEARMAEIMGRPWPAEPPRQRQRRRKPWPRPPRKLSLLQSRNRSAGRRSASRKPHPRPSLPHHPPGQNQPTRRRQKPRR